MAVAPEGAKRARRSSAETREQILTVASELFYWEGIRATGVDAVVARAEVAPTTLYRLFTSKDELVAAYVERCSGAYKERLTAASSPTVGTARDRILGLFDVFADEALSETCRGCPFMMVLAEFPDPGNPAHVQAVAHKAWLRDLIHHLVRELAEQTPLRSADALAEQLLLVADGIYGSLQSLGPSGPAQQGRSCAENLSQFATAA